MPKRSASANMRAKTRANARVSSPANPRKTTRSGGARDTSARTKDLIEKVRGENGFDKPKKKRSKKPSGTQVSSVVDALKDDIDDELVRGFLDEHRENFDDEDSEEFSRFNDVFEGLNEATGNPQKEFRADELGQNIQRAMLATVLSLLPIAEATARSSRKEGAFYSLVALCNHARELITDLKIGKDNSDQVRVIVERILRPANLGAGRILIEKMNEMKEAVSSLIDEAEVKRDLRRQIDDSMLDLARYLSDVERATAEKIEAFLLGDINAFEVPIIDQSPKKKKRKRRES